MQITLLGSAFLVAWAKKNVKTLAQRNKRTIFALANGQLPGFA